MLGLPSQKQRPPSTLPPVPVPVPKKTGDSLLMDAFLQKLSSHRSVLENNVLSYKNVNGVVVKSNLYTWETLLQSVAYSYDVGYAGMRFYLGDRNQSDDDDESTIDLRYALVNIAAFLAQSQSEGIIANACDEYHSDSIDGKFPVSNSCGQFGGDYSESCSSFAEKAMECPVVESMKATAVLSGKYVNSLYDYRPNFYCGPEEQYTGAYDPDTMLFERGPSANQAGRTDVKVRIAGDISLHC